MDPEYTQELEHRISLLGGSKEICPPRGCPFPIVGIGSTGGWEAVVQLLQALPAGTGMAFVSVFHAGSDHPDARSLLAAATTMPVRTIENGMRIEPDTVYLAPSGLLTAMGDGAFKLKPREAADFQPIDWFLDSLAKEQGGTAIAVILSGNTFDGVDGVGLIKAECGITLVEEQATARYPDVPRKAMATGAIDFVLTPAAIAHELARIARHPFLLAARAGYTKHTPFPDDDVALEGLFALLERATRVDFKHYTREPIRRRIRRRMIVQGSEDLSEYLSLLQNQAGELNELFRELVVIASQFFREPATLTSLRSALVRSVADDSQTIRVWVPGCATGEEVYTLAICIDEMLQERGRPLALRVFGTDIDEFALNRARQGIYTQAITRHVSRERLARYFVPVDGGYAIAKEIRARCTFARQDLTQDPPFSQLDVISCRDALLHFDPLLKSSIVPALHYGLKEKGLLMLRAGESIQGLTNLFEPDGPETNIYCRKAKPVSTADLPARRQAAGARTNSELQKRINRVLEQNNSDAAVVVDSDLKIIRLRGHTSPFLEPPPHDRNCSLLRVAREELILPLRRAFKAAVDGVESVREPAHLTNRQDGLDSDLVIEIAPIAGIAADHYYLVTFQAMNMSAESETPLNLTSREMESLVHRLRRELKDTRQQLSYVSEDHSTDLEELQTANEEVRSTNEELQSANEELSTTKEELQSANEELRNINNELNSLNDDLKNLLGSVNIPILIVDNNLRVRRFTAPAEKLLNLNPPDVGRRLSEIQGKLPNAHLENLVIKTLETLTSAQQEVQNDSGTWYSVSARPFRTAQNRIDGAILAFINVDPLKRGLQAAEHARDYAEAVIETVREPLVVLDADLRVRRATAAFYQAFQVSRQETEGRNLYDLGNGHWDIPRLREALGDALFRDISFHDLEIERDFPYIGKRTMRLNGRRISQAGEASPLVLLAVEDVTERKEASEIRYMRLFEAAKDGILVLDAESGTVTDVNPQMLELTGYDREQFAGLPIHAIEAFRWVSGLPGLVDELRRNPIARRDNVRLHARDGREIIVEIIANCYCVGTQQVIQCNVRDMSDRRRAEAALRETEDRFRLFVESVRDYALFLMDVDGNVVSWNAGAERLFGYRENEILGRSAGLFLIPEDVENGELQRRLTRARNEGRSVDEQWHMRKDGTRFWGTGVLTLIRDDFGRLRGFAKIMRDETARKQTDQQLQAALRDKELLLREIHHRVKNNLQVITSLLSLQASGVTDDGARKPLEEMRDRVRAIGRIHEVLYKSQHLSEVDMSENVDRLARDLVDVYGVDQCKIQIDVELNHTCLNIEQAMPVGLIVNELVSNALKHAFPNRHEGTILVSLSRNERNDYVLVVSDNGVGLPDALDVESPHTLGLRLVRIFVEQLRGTSKHTRTQGARFEITFPAQIPKEASTAT